MKKRNKRRFQINIFLIIIICIIFILAAFFGLYLTNKEFQGNLEGKLNTLGVNSNNVPLIYSRLSELAHRKGQLKQAIKLARKAVKENTKLANKYVQVELLINLAKLLKEKKLSAPAKEAFKDALAVSKEIEYPKMEELYKMEIGAAQNTK